MEGKPRDFLVAPFWKDIYLDNYSIKMVVGGRQIFKSTYATDMLAYMSTVYPGTQSCYVTHEQASLTAFSKQKLQIGTFSQNPILGMFSRNKLGNIGEFSLKNDSTIYCVIDNDKFKHVEGKSLALCILDEGQYLELGYFSKILQTVMATKGRIEILGVGGEAGSSYHEIWNKTDQREWVWDNPNWRDDLQFGPEGVISGAYLEKVLSGHWVAQKPENTFAHGYHIPQTIVPTIPLTIDDAITKYKIHHVFSLEYQQKNLSSFDYATHSLGQFYSSQKRPVTEKMVRDCMERYGYLGLCTPLEIAVWKYTMQNQIMVSMGVDFGSGNSSSTVITILIHWLKSKRLHLAYVEKRPPENQLDQAEYITNLFKYARCDVGVGDLGYGANQIKLIQDGGNSAETGEEYEGVGNTIFVGCRTVRNESKPLHLHDSKTDEHGEEVSRYTIDKTVAIQQFVNILEENSFHPGYDDGKFHVKRLIIPHHAERTHETEWLVKEFTSISRKNVDGDNVGDSSRMEYGHPPDSVMSLIYAVVGLNDQFRWTGGSKVFENNA